MPGDILIVDSVATNRIVLKVKLLAAQYRVRPCSDLTMARAEIKADRPDLVLLDISADTEAALDFCKELKSGDNGDLLPVIATGGFLSPVDRVRALKAGADDVLARPFHDQILHARIRSLLRARDANMELRLREDTRQALGFAEAESSFVVPATVTVLSPVTQFVATQTEAFASLPNIRVTSHAYVPREGLPDVIAGDLILIDGNDLTQNESDLFRLLSELRSRTDTRHAAILVILPADVHWAAAMALDLGANDIVPSGVIPEEILLRGRELINDKLRADQLRRTVKTGLQAAVTDALTGLYNRRYALPHLSKMVERAQTTGRQIAVMVLDIDHFKSINDSYGHAAGDEVLKQVAERLRGNVRAVDLLARIGGEEFLIAVPESDATHAKIAAERLCALISNTPFFVGAQRKKIDLTTSIGVSLSGSAPQVNDATSPEEIVQAADSALYAAKGLGRNTVSLSAA